MLAADGLRSLMLMKLFPWASATYIHILEYCDERFFDFGPWLLSVLGNHATQQSTGLSTKFSMSFVMAWFVIIERLMVERTLNK